MKPHTHTVHGRSAEARSLRQALFAASLAGAMLFVPLAGSHAYAAQSLQPETIPGLPQESLAKSRVPATTKQEDREFLQQIEGAKQAPAVQSQDLPMEDASTSRLAKLGPAHPELAPAPAPEPAAIAPAQPSSDSLSPAEVATTRIETPDRDAETPVVTQSRNVELRRASSVRHTTSRELPSLIAEGDGTTDIAPPAGGGFQAPASRTNRTVTTYTSNPPSYQRVVTVEPADGPYVSEPLNDARPRHHGFFHRIFHHDDY